jgi:hypothetical protein
MTLVAITGPRTEASQMWRACEDTSVGGRSGVVCFVLVEGSWLVRWSPWGRGAARQGRDPLIVIRAARNSSSGICNQPGEHLVEFQTLFFCLPPRNKCPTWHTTLSRRRNSCDRVFRNGDYILRGKADKAPLPLDPVLILIKGKWKLSWTRKYGCISSYDRNILGFEKLHPNALSRCPGNFYKAHSSSIFAKFRWK